MRGLFYSAVTGKIIYGNGKQRKENPEVYGIVGKKTDITESFYNCLLQVFTPGSCKTLYDKESNKPLYEIYVREFNDES